MRCSVTRPSLRYPTLCLMTASFCYGPGRRPCRLLLMHGRLIEPHAQAQSHADQQEQPIGGKEPDRRAQLWDHTEPCPPPLRGTSLVGLYLTIAGMFSLAGLMLARRHESG